MGKLIARKTMKNSLVKSTVRKIQNSNPQQQASIIVIIQLENFYQKLHRNASQVIIITERPHTLLRFFKINKCLKNIF